MFQNSLANQICGLLNKALRTVIVIFMHLVQGHRENSWGPGQNYIWGPMIGPWGPMILGAL